MGITKSHGVTPTESLLADLCDQTFLRLWSFPNPFRDDGNELCDLLAIFGDHVFVFFDREGRQFTKTDRDPLHNWEQWKRVVVDRQVRSTHGAERYLRSGRRVFLDSKREVPFPIEIPVDRMIVHKVVVAHGAKEACEAFSADNVYGSLGITYSNRPDALNAPFMIHLSKDSPVHVLDSHTLPIILGELDTFTDLAQYFDAKVAAINSLDHLAYCGEEDLLAHYFLNYDSTTNRNYIGTKQNDVNGVMVGEGEWKDFIERREYQNKKQADRTSYFWDEIIQRTCQNALDGTLLGNANLLKGRSAIHEMAREPRFMRRALSDEMLRVVESFPDMPGRISRHVSLMPSFYPDKAYVFLQLRVKNVTDREGEHRKRRQALLEIACGAARNKSPHLKVVIGIAIDAPKFTAEIAEDFILMVCHDWPDEHRAYYEEANSQFQFFGTESLKTQERNVKNFPDK